ncbi:MAG: carboxymuconolactone decarboxylase family protein [Acidimicrobiales bacterium]
MARLDPPPRSTLDKDVDDLLTLASSADGEPLGTIAVLAHRPQLLGPFLGWAAALALSGTLSKRDHEILALRASYRCGSSFEWGEHAEYGRQAGLSPDELSQLGQEGASERGTGGGGWTAAETALIRAADELVGGHALSDETWTELARHFDAAALVEVPFVIGQYTMLSMVANGLGVPSVPGSMPLPR